MSTRTRELSRKLVHVSFGVFAFSLRWLSPWQAAIVAVIALIFNRFVLRHVGGKWIARGDRGYDLGILIYPGAVLVLILSFYGRPELAAACWLILAFGDGMATVAGHLVRSPRLPWNRSKSWAGLIAFVAFAVPVAYAGWIFVGEVTTGRPAVLLIVALTVVAAAIAESLDLRLDDNVTVPLVSALTIALLSTFRGMPAAVLSTEALIWLSVNLVLAVVGYLARSVDVSGMIGGFLLGAVLILFAGWQLYVVLLLFFVIGSGVTKIGYRRKESLGLAQEEGGRRGFSHAFSNVGVASILALSVSASALDPRVLWLAAISSLATATADTTASEVGQLLGRRPFLPLTFRRVPVGTEGAISVEGTVAGAAAALIVAVASVWLIPFDVSAMLAVSIIAGAAIAGSYIESIVGSWNRRRAERVPNGALNFFNTIVGAVLALVAAKMWL